jgi:hypothetical protein
LKATPSPSLAEQALASSPTAIYLPPNHKDLFSDGTISSLFFVPFFRYLPFSSQRSCFSNPQLQ